jgi:putative ABC transport system permease protein
VLPPALEQALSGRGLVSAGVRAGTAHAFGANLVITGVDPVRIGHFYHFTWAAGSGPADLRALSGTDTIVTSEFATAHHLTRGSTVVVQTTSGRTLRLTVRGICTTPKVTPLLGAMTITTPLFDRGFTTPGDGQVYVDTGPGQSRTTVAAAVRGFTTAQVRTLAGFITAQESSIGTILNLLYVLLILCVVISLLGIINTLALSVTERTREIGILRAIGMTRTQLRRMIRIESEITALIGAIAGIVTGLILAGLAAIALSAWSVGLSVPWTLLAIVIVAAVLAGAAAGLGPARRAARLDPLAAISYE